MTPSDDLSALLGTLVHLSHRIGQDPRLVQPGGGNTSLKTDDALLVKGSGTDLRTIGPRRLHPALPRPARRRCVRPKR